LTPLYNRDGASD